VGLGLGWELQGAKALLDKIKKFKVTRRQVRVGLGFKVGIRVKG
jgi:hypothetical protein